MQAELTQNKGKGKAWIWKAETPSSALSSESKHALRTGKHGDSSRDCKSPRWQLLWAYHHLNESSGSFLCIKTTQHPVPSPQLSPVNCLFYRIMLNMCPAFPLSSLAILPKQNDPANLKKMQVNCHQQPWLSIYLRTTKKCYSPWISSELANVFLYHKHLLKTAPGWLHEGCRTAIFN